MADKYKKLKRQVSSDGGFTWSDLIPYEYMAGELIQRDSPDCNNVEWRTVSGYICEENTTEMTQWVADTGYVCVGFDKYNKEKEQVSYNSGISWADTGNTRAGSTLIEQNSEDCGYHDYSVDYLTTEALGSGNIILEKNYLSTYEDKIPLSNIQYSKNDGAWTSYTYDTAIQVVNGDKIRWKAQWNDGNDMNRYYNHFTSTASYKIYGNPISLLLNDNFENVTNISSYQHTFNLLFKENTTLTDAFNLSLPATTLTERCYRDMFNGCTSLTNAPVLPATSLANACYWAMFEGCTSLTVAPALPATTLGESCYGQMFHNCTSLTSAPSLPAATLTRGCYSQMFWGCTSLVTPPVLSATTLARECYMTMFSGCTSLTVAPALPATTLAYGCYSSMFSYCSSLTSVPTLSVTTLASNCYSQMFRNCTSLTTAPELPATTLATGCYDGMFYNCTSLVTPPVLSATTLAEDCYRGMFYGCTSLTTAPALPAATLTQYCYRDMFSNCTSLTTAPVLPATTLANQCYAFMFNNCTSLNSVTCCATDISATDCTKSWLYNVAQTGTFNKDSNTTWPTGTSGIPSRWTTDTCGCEHDYSTEYLTTEALESGNISLNRETLEDYQDKYPLTNIQYLKNDGSWTPYTYNTLISVVNGDKIKWKAQWNDGVQSFMYRNAFKSTGRYKAYGNPLSLLLNDNFSGVTSLRSYYCAFGGLFDDEVKLTDVSDISLPATTLEIFCYTGMFNGCSLITTAPKLPATTLAGWCYQGMFSNCTSLTTAPELPATTLATNSCYQMFWGCTSLTTAPTLPATTLAEACYEYMFYGCTSLNHVKCYATNIKALNCTKGWLTNVAATGTFETAGASWKTGVDGIPSGWTIVDAT